MQTAVVTGATGYISGELIRQLLEKGYNVRGTVRSKNSHRYSALTALAKALQGTLDIYEADLLVDNSFDEVVRGSDFVFHVASPVVMEAEDPMKELVQPAVQGSLNLLRSVARSKDTVKRVVLTSSTAGLQGYQVRDPPVNGIEYTESDWNRSSTLEQEPYQLSKVEAEKAAWAFAKEHGIDLVTILPSFVLGPVLSSATSGLSVGWMRDWLSGKTVPFQYCSAIDVRDVAHAHVLAATIPSASGRYIVANPGTFEIGSLARALQERFSNFVIPNKEDMPKQPGMTAAKAERELGVKLTPLNETIVDMAVTMLQLGMVQPQLKQ